jgi:iron complex outermembrane receptor protein
MSGKKSFLGAVAVAALGFGGPAYAQDAVTVAAGAETADEIVVIGTGQSLQGQSISGLALEELAPGTSPIKLVQRLPGVAVSGADPFGAYEWALRINIRGFAQNQLGFTLDGVPLGDMAYGNHNGLHISRALISENLGRAQLTQGSGSLDVASSNNLGGALRFSSLAPSEEFAVATALTYGSEDTLRGFVRLETGEIEGLGTRAWLAYMNSQMDLWKGDGEQNQEQIGLRVDQPVGEGMLTAYFNHSERREQDYQDFSLEMFDRLGYDFNNFGLSNYAGMIQVATAYNTPANFAGPTPILDGAGCWTGNGVNPYPAPVRCVDDAYLDASGLRDDDLGYIALDMPLNEAVSFRLQAYLHQNEGQGLWGTPYRPSPNFGVVGATTANAPFSIRTTEYDIDRRGLIGALNIDLGAHDLEAGFWRQTNDFNVYRRFYAMDLAAPNRSFQSFQSNPFFTQYGYAFETDTLQLYVQDNWQVTDALSVNFGFRSLNVENTVDTLTINNAAPVPGADSDLNGSIETEENFLPQAGFVYEINDSTEVFGSYAKNVAAWNSVVFGATPFSSRSQANFEEVRRSSSPEEAQVFEGGVRVDGAGHRLSAVGYFVQFDNRLLAISQGPGIVGNAPVVSNVGSVETIGLELLGAFDLSEEWSLLTSYTYNQSEYQDDVRNRSGVLLAATAGATVVNTPEHIFHGELGYDNGALFGSVSANYLSQRYFTFTNVGGRVDGRTLLDATLGYRFSGNGLLDGLEAQLNVTNLTDEDYAGALGTNGFVNAGDSQTLIAGAPRQIFVTLRKEF